MKIPNSSASNWSMTAATLAFLFSSCSEPPPRALALEEDEQEKVSTPEFGSVEPTFPILALPTQPPEQIGDFNDDDALEIAGGKKGIFSPYAVALRNEAGETRCGGTFISPHVVLTAAHCVYGQDLKTVTTGVSAGSPRSVHNITSERLFPGWPPKRRVRGPKGDLALLTVDRPFQAFGGAMPGVFDPIADFITDYDGLKVTLVGYGPNERGVIGFQRFAETVVQDGSKSNLAGFLLYSDASHSTRPGDSGGPTYIVRNGRRYLVGVHHGFLPHPTIDYTYYGADTQVGLPEYSNWIYQNALALDPPQALTVNYNWPSSSGTDLDTRTLIITPVRFVPVGWGKGSIDGPSNRPYLNWVSSDNRGSGSERVAVNLNSLIVDYPPVSGDHVYYIGQAAFWFGSKKSGIVELESKIGEQVQAHRVTVDMTARLPSSNGQAVGTVTFDTWSRQLYAF